MIDYSRDKLDYPVERRILANKAKCLMCFDMIESTHRHDFTTCNCGNIFVDGGTSYVRFGSSSMATIELLTEYV